jgi:glycosyltransferase involved in cell wall biosynthesis
MSILFGHPTGNPNSFHAALAHLEHGRLAAFCVPWMPSARALHALAAVPPIRPLAQRLARRRFEPLDGATLVQGRPGEWLRLAKRALGMGSEALSYEANEWLMRTMRAECRRSDVAAVHAYEDCSLWQFEEARRLGKACIYDMPIGYHAAWAELRARLGVEFAEWLPAGGVAASRFERPAQKVREMELADLVLVPSEFVAGTVRAFHPGKRVAVAAYGVDSAFWEAAPHARRAGPLRFIYAGQLSLRKGIPLLMQAWEAAALEDCRLELVGDWRLAEDKRARLPRGVSLLPACSRPELRARYQAADVFVFPTYFEGFGLVLLEAMACGLPAIATQASGADRELLAAGQGRRIAAGDLDALVESLRWFARHADEVPAMGRAAVAAARSRTWDRYRAAVSRAVEPLA